MNFKKQLRAIQKQKKAEEKKAHIEYKKSLMRSDEDWVIIEKFLSERILEETKRTGKRWITLYCLHGDLGHFSQKDIILSNQKSLVINYQDMKRFCRQHHFKLLFLNETSYRKTIEAHWYDDILTNAYLIRV